MGKANRRKISIFVTRNYHSHIKIEKDVAKIH